MICIQGHRDATCVTRYVVTWRTLELLSVLRAVTLSPTELCNLASCLIDLPFETSSEHLLR